MRRILKFDPTETKAFFRAFFLTLVCIGCIGGAYIGMCRAYEAIRKTCFDDDRGAVIITEDYFKFFDIQF